MLKKNDKVEKDTKCESWDNEFFDERWIHASKQFHDVSHIQYLEDHPS